MLYGENSRVFPAESVFAVIEVKSVLKKRELRDAVEKIRCIKNLNRDNGLITGVIFSYKSDYRNQRIERVVNLFREMNKELSQDEYCDLLCVLDSGVIQKAIFSQGLQKKFGLETGELYYFALSEFDIPILLWFFSQVLSLLYEQKSELPEYGAYIGEVNIGIGQLFTPVAKKLTDNAGQS